MKLKSPDTNKIKTLTDSVNSLTEQVEKINDMIFQFVVTNLFNEYPELKKFSFTGYTPAFNDGEECTFTLGTDYPEINDDEGNKEINIQLKNIVSTYLNILPAEYYNSHFGTNFRVIATLESIDVEDYDCGF
jgi:hypothetical protein